MNYSRNGFSVLEVLTVIGVLLFMFFILLGVFLKPISPKSPVRQTRALIQKLGLGLARYYAELRTLPPDTGYGLPLDGSMSGRTYDAGSLWRYLGCAIRDKQSGKTYGPYLTFSESELKKYTDPVYGNSYLVVDPWGSRVGYIGDPKRVIHNRDSFDIFSPGPDKKTACDDGLDNDGDGAVDNANHAYDGTGQGDAGELGEAALNGTLTGSRRKTKPGEVLDDINNWDLLD